MFDGQILIGGTSGPTIYSPWFPRQGDFLIATLQVISTAATGGTKTLKVEVATKNTEDTGDGTVVAGDLTIEANAASFTESNTWGPGVLKELVRFKFTISSDGDDWLFRMLDPVWYDAVQA